MVVRWVKLKPKKLRTHVSLLFLASHQFSPKGQEATGWDFAVPFTEIALGLAGSLPKQRLSVCTVNPRYFSVQPNGWGFYSKRRVLLFSLPPSVSSPEHLSSKTANEFTGMQTMWVMHSLQLIVLTKGKEKALEMKKP